MHLYAFIRICMHLYVFVCICAHLYSFVLIYVHLYAFVRINVHLCAFVCIYTVCTIIENFVIQMHTFMRYFQNAILVKMLTIIVLTRTL